MSRPAPQNQDLLDATLVALLDYPAPWIDRALICDKLNVTRWTLDRWIRAGNWPPGRQLGGQGRGHKLVWRPREVACAVADMWGVTWVRDEIDDREGTA